ncbi:MAG: chitosanase [Bacteroidota bacterium]
MQQLIVTAEKLNKRSSIPANLPDPTGITGVVLKGYTFQADEVADVPNAALGKWYQDRDNNFYWGGAVTIIANQPEENTTTNTVDNSSMETSSITPVVKKKVMQVVNAFETGSAEGSYGALVKYKDYKDPVTNTLMVQVTFGRSQTTEFGHLKALIQDYVISNGAYANTLSTYVNRIGQQPSLATDDVFCNALKEAGKNDPVMKKCQDDLFEVKFYQPAYHWFTTKGFAFPLSMLVIYDSTIHSGSIPSFLCKRFTTAFPVNGGNEKDWITNYVNARNNWLATNSNPLLQKTVYRTGCLLTQAKNDNWDLVQPITANGVSIR